MMPVALAMRRDWLCGGGVGAGGSKGGASTGGAVAMMAYCTGRFLQVSTPNFRLYRLLTAFDPIDEVTFELFRLYLTPGPLPYFVRSAHREGRAEQ
jgi:hypothetical protein